MQTKIQSHKSKQTQHSTLFFSFGYEGDRRWSGGQRIQSEGVVRVGGAPNRDS